MLGIIVACHNPEDALPGARVDMIAAYQYMQRIKCTRTIVYTDMQDDKTAPVHPTTIYESVIDEKHSASCLQHTLTHTVIYLRDPVISQLSKELQQLLSSTKEKHVVFYYTGHATDKGLAYVTKNLTSLLTFTDLRNLLDLTLATKFVILDCCSSTSLELPYTWKKNDLRFRLTNSSALRAKSLITVICAARDPGDKTLSTSRGSYFTIALIEALTSLRLTLTAIPFNCLQLDEQDKVQWNYGTNSIRSIVKYIERRLYAETKETRLYPFSLSSSTPSLQLDKIFACTPASFYLDENDLILESMRVT